MDAIQSRRRHLAKTITWRLIGTVDTILIGWVVTGDPWIGVQVGVRRHRTTRVAKPAGSAQWARTRLPRRGTGPSLAASGAPAGPRLAQR